MVRNAGKFGKPKRGGKKQFSENLDRGDQGMGMWDEEGAKGSEEESEEGSDEEEESDDSEEGSSDGSDLNSKLASTSLNPGSSSSATTGAKDESNQTSIAQSRLERKANKKNKKLGLNKADKDDEDEEDGANLDQLGLGNSNRAVKKSVKINEISKVQADAPMNRKEREAMEKKAAQERYWKLHQAGKTDEAKVDLARLAKIRQEREQAAAFRKAEAEAKAKEAADRAALSGRKGNKK